MHVPSEAEIKVANHYIMEIAIEVRLKYDKPMRQLWQKHSKHVQPVHSGPFIRVVELDLDYQVTYKVGCTEVTTSYRSSYGTIVAETYDMINVYSKPIELSNPNLVGDAADYIISELDMARDIYEW